MLRIETGVFLCITNRSASEFEIHDSDLTCDTEVFHFQKIHEYNISPPPKIDISMYFIMHFNSNEYIHVCVFLPISLLIL